ncbi:MAG: hypothetical protein ACJ79S_08210 [Gemmatimonadaceae bacterium]
MTLADLADRLDAFAHGRATHAELRRWFDALLAADALGAEQSDSAPWDAAPDDARLFWRLVYLFEFEADERSEGGDGGAADEARLRRLARRILDCLARTGSAAATFELLPLLTDQERFCAIVRKHATSVISRTGFLSVLAESGYPPHVKLWLEHAQPAHLARLCTRLEQGAYDEVEAGFGRRPE